MTVSLFPSRLGARCKQKALEYAIRYWHLRPKPDATLICRIIALFDEPFPFEEDNDSAKVLLWSVAQTDLLCWQNKEWPHIIEESLSENNPLVAMRFILLQQEASGMRTRIISYVRSVLDGPWWKRWYCAKRSMRWYSQQYDALAMDRVFADHLGSYRSRLYEQAGLVS